MERIRRLKIKLSRQLLHPFDRLFSHILILPRSRWVPVTAVGDGDIVVNKQSPWLTELTLQGKTNKHKIRISRIKKCSEKFLKLNMVMG